MADFYPVLSRAISGLQEQTPQARRAIYDRARQVLVAQLRGVSPPISESDITRQRLALDDVISRIELEHAKDHEPVEAAPVVVPPPIPAPVEPAVQPPAQEPAKSLRPSFASLLPAAGEEADKPLPVPVPLTGHADSAEPMPAEAAAVPDRPRLDITAAPRSHAGSKRKLIVLGGVALGLAAVGTAAFYVNRDNLAPQVAIATPPPPPQQPGGPKISERVGADPAPVPAPAAPTPSQPGAAPRGELAVAQRAVLYMEPQEATQQPRAVVGRVSWRLEAQNTGQGQLLETVIRADVDIADAGLQLAFTLRRNMDAAFPASHILGMRFQRSSDDGNGAVREAGVPQFKQEESERGAPLSAITTGLGDNLFISALSRVPVEIERNIDLIRTRNWIDIPVRFASGKRGIIAFEKGLSGDQRITEGLAAWR
ncbi:MAG: hypothetical protein ACRCUE_10665 [Bosea sp. (in: a-proteobacteria)]